MPFLQGGREGGGRVEQERDVQEILITATVCMHGLAFCMHYITTCSQ